MKTKKVLPLISLLFVAIMLLSVGMIAKEYRKRQQDMGHADITTTMDIYNEATKDKKMESFAGLEGKIKIR